ncbi:PIG-L family deacetylase [Frankia sp. B2]|uniref:PIG-L deacetylase family protein n=1 Tax=unclassified Frankia TaxID=2632575 RepID=UPI0004616610|nr:MULTISPECIES: PIG-L deacetylase family protein [unclassified Frankia]KDA40609.1 putative LmbE-like protein [Frankia sp. BMG5.23]TFE28325.1 PIG-L family deacetylase [Frankia sp. B2]
MTDLLVVVPHPDDETLYAGGTIRQTTRRGHHVTVVTLTHGEAGRTLGVCSASELATHRRREFETAMSVLGVTDAFLLTYPDGTLGENLARVAEELCDLVNDRKPHEIITFPANGMNGHPDHVASHHATLDAVRRSQWEPARLLTFADPTEYRQDPRPGYLPPTEVNRLRVPPNRCHDISDVIPDKLRALGSYETQARSVVKFLRLHPEWFTTEMFHEQAR